MRTPNWQAAALGLSASIAVVATAQPPAGDGPAPSSSKFSAAPNGEYQFDTGVLRGKLRPDGKCLGLCNVTHTRSGTRLDRSNGLLSHYRVFTKGVRYGGGAWDWPGTAKLLEDGAVEVLWPAATNRPFEMKAVYRWASPRAIDVATIVKADQALSQFEVFLASYFSEGFTNSLVYVRDHADLAVKPGFLPAKQAYGSWLMFPRGPEALPIMQDGRWKLAPNPVDWVTMPFLARPVAIRRAPQPGLSAIIMTQPDDSFTIATPHQAEGHYSTYFSLFGRDVKQGETVSARARLVLVDGDGEDQAPKLYGDYIGALK